MATKLMFPIVIYKLGALLAQSLSLPAARKLSNVVGRLMCFLQRRNRRHLLRNLEGAFGDERSPRELKLLRRKIFQNFAVMVTDFLRMPLVTRESLGDLMTAGAMENARRLGAMAGPETPTIITSAHLGNWEAAAATVGLLAGPVSIIVDHHTNALVTSFFDGRRADKGIDVVPVSAFHRCFRALKRGHLVAIVGDRPTTGQGIMLPYFGRKALMPDGHAVLARRLRARIVPTFAVMGPDGKYEYLMDEPIEPRVTDDAEADVRDCAAKCLAVSERYIRRYPEQWYVFRPIWDTDGASGVDRQELRSRRARAREVET